MKLKHIEGYTSKSRKPRDPNAPKAEPTPAMKRRRAFVQGVQKSGYAVAKARQGKIITQLQNVSEEGTLDIILDLNSSVPAQVHLNGKDTKQVINFDPEKVEDSPLQQFRAIVESL